MPKMFLVIYCTSNSLIFLGNWDSMSLIKCLCSLFQLRVNLALTGVLEAEVHESYLGKSVLSLQKGWCHSPTPFPFLLP